MIFYELIRQFESAHIPQLSRPTRLRYVSMLDTHVKPAFASLPVEEVNTRRLDEWLASKRRDGLSWATRSNLRYLVSAIFTRAEVWGMYDGKNPARRASAGRKQPKYERRKLSVEQTKALLAKLPDDCRLICMVALFCGLRISEVLGLCWRHVDFNRGMLLIRQRYYRGDLDSTKTPNSDRDIPYGSLGELLRNNYPGSKASDQFCFEVKTLHGATRDDSTIRRYFLRKSAERLGLYYPGFGFHSLRREAVTSISSEAGAIQACRVAGHSRMDTTLLYGLDDYLRQEQAIIKIQKPYWRQLGVAE